MDNLKVLVVEDVVLVAKMNQIMLSQLGCIVTIAKTGAEAIDYFSRNKFDFVFMDLGLPDMDGLTVTETMRRLEEEVGVRTPIVTLTAHTSHEFRENSKQAGADDFLSKPLTLENASTVFELYVKPPNACLA